MPSEDQLRYFGADREPRRLPAWARAMMQIGASLAETDAARRRIVVGVTAPARDYAAALAAAAFVVRRNQLDPVEPDDAELHFELLRSLTPGTPIKLMQGGRLHEGRLEGVVERNGTELLAISTRKMTRYLPRKVALNVRVIEGSAGASSELRSRRIDVPPLVSGFFTGQAAAAYVTQTRLDCVLIGTVTQLMEDLTADEFVTETSPGEPSCLQDLVRASGAPGASAAHRSALIAGGADEDDLPEAQPRAVVFDSGRGYARLGHLWESAHHLVIIDRSQASADGAAEALNRAYFERASDEGLDGIECPPSLEIVSFEVTGA